MKVMLVNPDWSFEGSIYFGCREPHLPIELGLARALLEAAGHEVDLVDAHMLGLTHADVAARVAAADPDMVVVTTAPTYLFWRCAPPELRVPQQAIRALDGARAKIVAIGPHGSTTPRAALAKTGADIVVMGESEEVLCRLAAGDWPVRGTCWREGGNVRVYGGPQAARFIDQPPLSWPDALVARHAHHHHRFDAARVGPGAEVEASRGCPYHCSFCAKLDFRDAYRRRPAEVVLAEIDGLRAQGATYVYFIDEIFLPNRELLAGLAKRDIAFGVQTRIDLWQPDMLERLGRAGCVSVEAGIESLTPEGRDALVKRCRLSTDDLAARLIEARRHIPFVQANLIKVADDSDAEIARWRRRMADAGVWANDPVPMFPYPGSPDYLRLWGMPDDDAWERALDHYLGQFDGFSDLQDARPRRLADLELGAAP